MKKSKINIRKKVWEFSDKHSWFNKCFEIVSDILNKFSLGAIVFWLTLILIAIMVTYFGAEKEIREELSKIVGVFVTVIIVPIALENIKHRRKIKEQRLENNKLIYDNLTALLIEFMNKAQYSNEDVNKITDFINSNKTAILTRFDEKLAMYIYYLYREIGNNNKNSVDFFCNRILMHIRQEYNWDKSKGFPLILLDAIK